MCKTITLFYGNENSVDITLFVNGFPIVIMELKNQYTGQDINNSMHQFKFDRDPEEPIFRFNERSLVYFGVDLFECVMTTKLAKGGTYFLPLIKDLMVLEMLAVQAIQIIKMDLELHIYGRMFYVKILYWKFYKIYALRL